MMRKHDGGTHGTHLAGRGLVSTTGTLPPLALTELAKESPPNFLQTGARKRAAVSVGEVDTRAHTLKLRHELTVS